MTRRRLRTLAGILAGTLAGGGLIAVASAHGGDTSFVHSCVNKWSGIVRVVSPSADCKRWERSLDWGIQGPQGPQGPPGVAGYEQKAHQEFLDPGFIGEVSVYCSPGKKVLGGGYDKELDLVTVFSSEPSVGGNFVDNAWTVMVENTDSQIRQVTVSAICATFQ